MNNQRKSQEQPEIDRKEQNGHPLSIMAGLEKDLEQDRKTE